ncbi:MAG: FAD-dependent oxidoreductase [Kofleriaceae bacterium]|nr:FAD-dependent oxidoreductase [Kofleriaceae bacterium]
MTTLETTCCIVGGGPAGMIAGWLLARAGVDVIVLEKHADFFRDFRGDTIHPSTLELVYELGALDEFSAVPQTRIDHLDLQILGERAPGPDFRDLPTHCKEVALMPQWDFLDFVARQAKRYSRFRLIMEADCEDLATEGDRITGVLARTPDGPLEVRADLVVGADGRHSNVRDRAGLRRIDVGAPIDVLWMKLPKLPSDPSQVLGIIAVQQFLVMLDRGTYWQCAYLIEKGGTDAVKARGLPAFRRRLAEIAPFLDDRTSALASWDDIKLLTVVVDRLERWWRAGLICIGDAAHAMSPVGGVGINLAIQDAVALANRVAEPLREHRLTDDDLAAVQARREAPARRIQRLQVAIHEHVLEQILAGRGKFRLWLVRFALRHASWLRRKIANTVGVGQLEHVQPAPA